MMSKSLSTQLWSAHFPGSSLSDAEVFPKLVSPCGAEHLLLVAWKDTGQTVTTKHAQNSAQCWERHGSTKAGCCAGCVKQKYKSSP